MRYKTLFHLLLKLIGVVVLIFSLSQLIFFVIQIVVMSIDQSLNVRQWYAYIPWPYLLQLAIGLYLFFGGRWIVNLAIPSNRPYCHECGYELTRTTGKHCPECGTPITSDDLIPNDLRYTPASEITAHNSLDAISQAAKLEKRGHTAEALELYDRVAHLLPTYPDGQYAAARAQALRAKNTSVG